MSKFSMVKEAIILCGGRGKRLQSITKALPKPMVRIGDSPFLDVLIQKLIVKKVDRIILSVGYKKEMIKEYYAKSSLSTKVQILFSEEETPLGTAGAIMMANKLLRSNNFLVLNGDTFNDIPLEDFYLFHMAKKAIITLAVIRLKTRKDVGRIWLDRQGRVQEFKEKIDAKDSTSIWTNAGAYMMNRDIFRVLPQKHSSSLEYDIFPKLVNKGIYGFPFQGICIDIGTPSRYLRAKNQWKKLCNFEENLL